VKSGKKLQTTSTEPQQGQVSM